MGGVSFAGTTQHIRNGTNDHIGIALRTEEDKMITVKGTTLTKSGIFQRTLDQVNG